MPYVALQTPIGLELIRIWQNVLRVDKIGIHDDFLELGGNSLSAAQVISRIMQSFFVDLPAAVLFAFRQ